MDQPFELMINPKTNKVYSTYYGNPSLSIIYDHVPDNDILENYEVIIGMIGAGIIATIFIFFIKQKKKIKKEQ